MSIITTTTHDCYKYFDFVNCNNLFSCGGCKMRGFGEKYMCNRCGKELHKNCRYPQNSISHGFLGSSILTFRSVPFGSRYCNACGKDINGYSYYCGTDNRDLHPCCANLQEKLFVDRKFFNLKDKMTSKCDWCKQTRIDRDRNIYGWSYVTSCKKYHFHVYCMTEMLQEAFMRSGNSALVTVDVKKMIKSKKGSGGGKICKFLGKSVFKIALSALFGDPTTLFSHVMVEGLFHSRR